MHCLKSCSWCNGIEGMQCQLTGEELSLFYIYIYRCSVMVCKASMLDWFEGSHAEVYSKKEHFPMNLLRNPINVCWNHQNRARFSKMIDLRGHMARFTWKMNIFSSISWEMPEMCVVTIRRGFVFLRWSIWGVTYLGLLEKLMFSIYLLGIPINLCWNPQNRAHFSKTIDLRGHMPRFTLKMNVFPSISLENHKCVLKPSEQGLFLWDNWFEGSHA